MQGLTWLQYCLFRVGLGFYLVFLAFDLTGAQLFSRLVGEAHANEVEAYGISLFEQMSFLWSLVLFTALILCAASLILGWLDRIGALVSILLLFLVSEGKSQLLGVNLLIFLLIFYAFSTKWEQGLAQVKPPMGKEFEWRLNYQFQQWGLLILGIYVVLSLTLRMVQFGLRFPLMAHLNGSHFYQGFSFKLMALLAFVAPLLVLATRLFSSKRKMLLTLLAICALLALPFTGPDPVWLLIYLYWPWKQEIKAPVEWVFYDGHCGLCHKLCRMLLMEDPSGRGFFYAPLGGEYYRELVPASLQEQLPDSMLVKTGEQKILARAQAAIHIANRLDGPWKILARCLSWMPFALLEGGYEWIAKNRHRFFRRQTETCPMIPASLRERFHP